MKKLIFIISLFFTLACNCQVPSIGGMQFPRAAASGEGDASNIVTDYGGGSLAAAYNDTIALLYPYEQIATYPTYLANNEILIASIITPTSYTFTAPAGWEIIYQDSHPNASVAYFWKRADGTELRAGTIGFDKSTSANAIGYIHGFIGCITTGTPFDGLQTVAVNLNDSVYIPELTSAGSRYAVGVILVEDNTYTNSFTNYVELINVATTNATDLELEYGGLLVTAAGTVSQEDVPLSGTDYWSSIGLLLIAQP